MRIAKCGLVILLILPGGIVAAQQQTQQQAAQPQQADPLAAAARRARAQNKEKPKAAVVWNDDNISQAKGATINVLGETAPASENSGGPAANSGPANKPATASGDRAALDEAKAKLESLQTDLDLLERKDKLDQQMYYGTTDYAKDTDAAARLHEQQGDIESKQQEITDQQKKIDELQAELDAAPPSDNSSDTSKGSTSNDTSNSGGSSDTNSSGNSTDTGNNHSSSDSGSNPN